MATTSEFLIQQSGPNGNVDAFVEDDGRVVYLYLRGPEGRWLRPVWVQNRIAAPEGADQARMNQGNAPLMPLGHCRHPDGAPALNRARLRLVWLPEGNGVALFEAQALIAAVVPARGPDGFAGYAREALGQGPFAWELTGAKSVGERFAEAMAYWAAWDRSPDPWLRIQDEQLSAYEHTFGPQSRYFAIDGNQWPPRALIQIDRADAFVLATIGMALRPQPGVELHSDQPRSLRRVELGIVLPLWVEQPVIAAWSSYIAGQAGLPWARYTWLGPGHTIPCDVAGPRGYPAVLLAAGETLGLPDPLPPFGGDPVGLLWMTPITATEWQAAKTAGSERVLASLTDAWRTRA